MMKINTLSKKIALYLRFLFLHYHRRLHGFEVKAVNNPVKIQSVGLMLFCTSTNSNDMTFFLNYYRNLGVKQFIFLTHTKEKDTESTSLLLEEDVHVFYGKGSSKNINHLNYLLNKYGRNQWSIVCDIDEFFIYPYMDSRNVVELTSYLASINKHSLIVYKPISNREKKNSSSVGLVKWNRNFFYTKKSFFPKKIENLPILETIRPTGIFVDANTIKNGTTLENIWKLLAKKGLISIGEW